MNSNDAIPSEDIVESLAAAIVRRRLAVPAVFFLELHKPLAGVAQAALIFSMPFLMLFAGREQTRQLLQLLESANGIEALMRRVEQLNGAEGPRQTSRLHGRI